MFLFLHSRMLKIESVVQYYQGFQKMVYTFLSTEVFRISFLALFLKEILTSRDKKLSRFLKVP